MNAVWDLWFDVGPKATNTVVARKRPDSILRYSKVDVHGTYTSYKTMTWRKDARQKGYRRAQSSTYEAVRSDPKI